jgi:hypothetical protein
MEATPRNGKVVPNSAATHDARKRAKGGKKRRKQRSQWGMAVAPAPATDKNVDGSDIVCVVTAACRGKYQVRPPIDHFERLLEEACPSHTYPIEHKFKDCTMTKNFMTSGSLH